MCCIDVIVAAAFTVLFNAPVCTTFVVVVAAFQCVVLRCRERMQRVAAMQAQGRAWGSPSGPVGPQGTLPKVLEESFGVVSDAVRGPGEVCHVFRHAFLAALCSCRPHPSCLVGLGGWAMSFQAKGVHEGIKEGLPGWLSNIMTKHALVAWTRTSCSIMFPKAGNVKMPVPTATAHIRQWDPAWSACQLCERERACTENLLYLL